MPVVGVLFGGSPTTQRFSAIQKGLNAAGFVEGQNVAFEYRLAEGQYDRLPKFAAELAGRGVAVIVAIGNTAALAAKAAITSLPVVFETGIDPVEYGLVASLARPGGNFTGVTFLGINLLSKQFELLHEAVPRAAAIGLLENPTNSNAEAVRKEAQAAADALGQKLVIAEAIVESDLDAAFTMLVRQRKSARYSFRYPFQRPAAATRQPRNAPRTDRNPSLAGIRYGGRVDELRREPDRCATRGRRLCRAHPKGEKPADLPVQQSAKVELVINLKTAKALASGAVPLLGRADEVIE